MVKTKICGITNLDDALASVEAGADVLGFNFFRPSPRYISADKTRKIVDALPSHVLTVGVFVNERQTIVDQIAKESGVAALQLHGDESPEYCSALKDHYVIKVLGVDGDFDPKSVMAYSTQAIMLDALDRKARGGTGRVINWGLARRARKLFPEFFLSGGLSGQNVAEAIRIVRPYGVDACSALEITAGRKDHIRVRAFVAAAKDAAREIAAR